MPKEEDSDESDDELFVRWDDGEVGINGDHPLGWVVLIFFCVLFVLLVPTFWEIYVALAGGFMLFEWYVRKSTK